MKHIDLLEILFKSNNSEIIKYIIDNSINLECEINDNKWKPIHYVCRYSTPDVIKYLVDKGVDLECEDDKKWKPIHYVCRFSTPDVIKYLVDKGVDLECEQHEKWKPIHFICRYSTLDIIEYFINKKVDLNSKIAFYDNKPVSYDIIKLINLNEILKESEKNQLINNIRN